MKLNIDLIGFLVLLLWSMITTNTETRFTAYAQKRLTAKV
jgi:hypothetical protein